MLKLVLIGWILPTNRQPPSGGCVLKLTKQICGICSIMQPPSGGCVLKQNGNVVEIHNGGAATFGWLCVET